MLVSYVIASLMLLTVDFPDPPFEAYAAEVYWGGVPAPPAVGHEAIIAALKGLLSF
jgi:hypothetical protein